MSAITPVIPLPPRDGEGGDARVAWPRSTTTAPGEIVLRHAVGVELEIGFLLRGARGRVQVDLQPAAGADSSGRGLLDPSLPAAHGAGLPVCTATVDYEGLGYAAVMGWVQFVRSTDSDRPDVFELDPLALYRDVNTPYAFFGITPTLFDAPYRDPQSDLFWQARSYLATTPDAVSTPAAVPLLAFTWGFWIEAGAVTLEPPAQLGIAHWTDHLVVLEDAHPGWSFRG